MKSVLKICFLLIISAISTALYAKDTQQEMVYGITPGRANALIGLAMALSGLIFGWLALSNSTSLKSNKTGKTKTFMAVILGMFGIILSLIHLSKNTGDFGTGGGRAGAYVAFIIGFIGISLGCLTMLRNERNGRRSSHQKSETTNL